MAEKEVLEIMNRQELFLDHYLVARLHRARLRLNPPTRREIVLQMDQAWEGPGSGIYAVVFQDGDLYRMFYRATFPQNENDRSEGQGTAMALSKDGINWQRENLGLIDYAGQDTNLVFSGRLAHNFSPFLDKNPACPAKERYKAVCGHHPEGLLGYSSPDCLHWEKIQAGPLFTDGAFDSHNLTFFDSNKAKYACYSRYFADLSPDGGTSLSTSVRAIQSSESADFINWTKPRPHTYDPEVPFEHLYTNATVQCPGAEHIYLSFPMRFLHERHTNDQCGTVGISDNVLMSSRDGLHWDRPFLESWLKPGLDPRNWTHRNLIVSQGILETGHEFSLFVNENYSWDSSYIRRVTVPRHRFASVYADRQGGMLLTRPLVVAGDRLRINYATSAPGLIRVGIIDANGWPLAGYAAEDCDPIYGDELERDVSWRGKKDLAFLQGRAVSFKFILEDADLYALQLAQAKRGV